MYTVYDYEVPDGPCQMCGKKAVVKLSDVNLCETHCGLELHMGGEQVRELLMDIGLQQD